MGTLELISSCAPLKKFIRSSLKCVVYNVPIQSDTASKRVLAELWHIGVTDHSYGLRVSEV